MPADIHEDFPAPFGNSFGGKSRAQSVYQPASGEKHVLFYPTSPAPSAASDEHRSWSSTSYATSTVANSAAVAAASASTSHVSLFLLTLMRCDERTSYLLAYRRTSTIVSVSVCSVSLASR